MQLCVLSTLEEALQNPGSRLTAARRVTKPTTPLLPTRWCPQTPHTDLPRPILGCMLTLVVAVPPPTELTFSTSTGPCMSVSCVCCQCCTQILIRAASSVCAHSCRKNVGKYEKWCLPTSSRDKLFLVQLLSLSSPYWGKKWRSSSGSDVAVLICILHKLTNGRRLTLKTI